MFSLLFYELFFFLFFFLFYSFSISSVSVDNLFHLFVALVSLLSVITKKLLPVSYELQRIKCSVFSVPQFLSFWCLNLFFQKTMIRLLKIFKLSKLETIRSPSSIRLKENRTSTGHFAVYQQLDSISPSPALGSGAWF